MTLAELKPCPHCGKAPTYLDNIFAPSEVIITCCATMKGPRDRDETIAKWNRRDTETAGVTAEQWHMLLDKMDFWQEIVDAVCDHVELLPVPNALNQRRFALRASFPACREALMNLPVTVPGRFIESLP